MNNIKILTKVSVYKGAKKVSKSSFEVITPNTGDIIETAKKMYKNMIDYYTPLAKNTATSFACKDTYNYIIEYGVCGCTIQHTIGDVSVIFQMSEVLYHTK